MDEIISEIKSAVEFVAEKFPNSRFVKKIVSLSRGSVSIKLWVFDTFF